MEEAVASPLVNGILGTALLTVLGVLTWFIKLWREDLRSDRKRGQDLAETSARVVEANTTAMRSVAEKIKEDTVVTQELVQQFKNRPCQMKQEERAAVIRAADQLRAAEDG